MEMDGAETWKKKQEEEEEKKLRRNGKEKIHICYDGILEILLWLLLLLRILFLLLSFPFSTNSILVVCHFCSLCTRNEHDGSIKMSVYAGYVSLYLIFMSE